MRREVRVKGCMNKKYISTEIYFLFNKDHYTNCSQQVDSSTGRFFYLSRTSLNFVLGFLNFIEV